MITNSDYTLDNNNSFDNDVNDIKTRERYYENNSVSVLYDFACYHTSEIYNWSIPETLQIKCDGITVIIVKITVTDISISFCHPSKWTKFLSTNSLILKKLNLYGQIKKLTVRYI